ncbi:MAG: hypothetical protein BGP08_21095 [Rhizobiales bacterium 64-17]|nr:MAG: hypothetical protein BGP08_21095 [Rhizobiales bacterium 64-17]
MKWHVAALRFEIAMLRHARILRKAGFRPDQARDEQGRWVEEGRDEESSGDQDIGDALELSAQRKPDGHHFVPRAVVSKFELSDDAISEFENAKTGKLFAEKHGWSAQHRTYNEAVEQKLEQFLKSNMTRAEDTSAGQARQFVDEIKWSRDPRIRGLNMKISTREIMHWIRRMPRAGD